MLIKAPQLIRSANRDFGINNFGLRKKIITTPNFVNETSFSFDGVDDNIIVSNSNSLEPLLISFGCWFNWNSNSGNDIVLFQKNYNQSTPSYGFEGIKISSSILRIYIQLLTVNSYYYSYIDISNNYWYLILGVFNGTTLNLYLNNTLITSIPTIGAIRYNQSDLSMGFFLPQNVYYWKGFIDDVFIISKDITITERNYIYNSGIPNDLNLFGSDLKLWLRGDGDTLPIALDHSGNNNHGTAYNGVTLSTDVP